MNGIVDIINKVIAGILPGLNKNIQKLIQNEGYDPMARVVSGNESAGRINLGICTAHAEAGYAVKNLRGLSSLTIEKISVDSVSGDVKSFSASVSISLKLSNDLAAGVSGKLSAGCGFIHESVGLSGEVKASDITLSAHGVLNGGASIEEAKATLQSINVTSVDLNYQDVDAKINGLGIFNSLLGPVTSIISGAFKSYITGSLDGVIKGIINEEMRNLLPYSVKIPIPAELVEK